MVLRVVMIIVMKMSIIRKNKRTARMTNKNNSLNNNNCNDSFVNDNSDNTRVG